MAVGHAGAPEPTWVDTGEMMDPSKEAVTTEPGKQILREANTGDVKRGMMGQGKEMKPQISKSPPAMKMKHIMQQWQW